MTPQETDLDMPMNVQEPLVEVWVSGGLLQGWGIECSSTCMGPFAGGPHYLPHLHHSLASGQATGREHSPFLLLSHQEEQWPATGALGAADLGNGPNPLGGGCH